MDSTDNGHSHADAGADGWQIPQDLPPWARRVDESADAYSAFRQYRDLGSGRSLVKVGRLVERHDTLLERWSSQHAWGGTLSRLGRGTGSH